jgi:hypothetical protein
MNCCSSHHIETAQCKKKVIQVRGLDLNKVKSFAQQTSVFNRQDIPVLSSTNEKSIDLDHVGRVDCLWNRLAE